MDVARFGARICARFGGKSGAAAARASGDVVELPDLRECDGDDGTKDVDEKCRPSIHVHVQIVRVGCADAAGKKETALTP